MGTPTVTPAPVGQGREDDVFGRRRVRMLRITMSNSYATGGEVLGLLSLGVKDPQNAQYFFQQRAPLTGGYECVYDRVNDKLLVFWDGAGPAAAAPQVTNATDLSAVIFDCFVIEA